MKTKAPSPDLEYYLGKLQPEYESAGQAEIGRMLDDYQIQFFYKEPHLVWENGERQIKRPDFTLPTYNNTVIEYITSPDQATEQNKDLYRQNRISALFLEESDLAVPNWQQKLYDRLEDIYHQPQVLSADRYQPS